jgi:hypothetical protein
MVTLTKAKATGWIGNGFGTTSAEWVVKGHENIEIRKIGGWWVAVDGGKRIARAWDKRDLVAKLETLIA